LPFGDVGINNLTYGSGVSTIEETGKYNRYIRALKIKITAAFSSKKKIKNYERVTA